MNRRQAIIWTNAAPIHWHIYAALGGHVKVLNCILTHWDWGKIGNIFLKTYSSVTFWKENYNSLVEISPKFILKSPE